MALAVFPTGNINITTDLWTWRNFPSVWLKLHFCRLNLSVISQPTVTNSIFPTEENNALRWRKGEDHHTHQVFQFYELSPLQKKGWHSVYTHRYAQLMLYFYISGVQKKMYRQNCGDNSVGKRNCIGILQWGTCEKIFIRAARKFFLWHLTS